MNDDKSILSERPEAGQRAPTPWAMPARAVAHHLDTDLRQGLEEQEAERRLERDGPNKVSSVSERSWWSILLGQFRSIVVWLLAFAAAVAWLTENGLEAAAIVVVLVLNALIGFAIEWQAGRSLDALRKKSGLAARVKRGGRLTERPAEELVTGDLISLTAGDRVPADARLVESYALQTDESALTGESLPVQKRPDPVDQGTLLGDRSPMVWLGTVVRAGRGLAIVTATGSATELGAVGKLISEASSEPTPLEKRLALLGERLVYLVLAIAGVVFVAGLIRGDGIWLMLEVSISLAVAAVPEGLPAVTTLILAFGVIKMAKRNAIVRKLAAVETLGSTTVICADKTGTLTENRIAVREFHTGFGDFGIGSNELSESEQRLVRAGVLCNEASFEDPESGAIGEPTEVALLEAASALGMDVNQIRHRSEILSETPFDPDTKRMTTVRRIPGEGPVAIVKGAPGVVLGACDEILSEEGVRRDLGPEERRRLEELNESLAGEALRVLAFAQKNVDGSDGSPDDGGFTFLGFAGMSDPLRTEAANSISAAGSAGIRVVMLTGDQLNTARAIAAELGLGDGESAVHASELEGRSAEDLRDLVGKAAVFARVSPADKYRIVKALQEAGEIVAVTGDGINDAPALKQADIGVAMGARGTEVAKEAADIVLTDDNFATIVKAVAGGRTIYANILRFVHMMFSENLAEVLVIFVSMVLALPLPLLPLQILWVNLVTDVFPALALAVEPATENTMRRPPRSASAHMLSGRFLLLIGWQGVMLSIIVLGAYVWALGEYGEGDHARTIALMALIGVQLGHFFNCRSRVRSVFSRMFSNPWIFVAAAAMIILQIAAVAVPQLAMVLRLTVPGPADLAVIAACLILPIIVVEIFKIFVRMGLDERV